MPRIFISHSSSDRRFADDLVELFRIHYLDSWYSPRDIPAGQWEQAIAKGLNDCDAFVVVLSPDALASSWVQREVNLALQDRRYVDREQIVPVLARPCAWQSLHPDLQRYNLVDFTADREEAISRLLYFWHVDRYVFKQFQAGDMLMPVYRFLGGDGRTRFSYPDGVIANVPVARFELPAEIAAIADAGRLGGILTSAQPKEESAEGKVGEPAGCLRSGSGRHRNTSVLEEPAGRQRLTSAR